MGGAVTSSITNSSSKSKLIVDGNIIGFTNQDIDKKNFFLDFINNQIQKIQNKAIVLNNFVICFLGVMNKLIGLKTFSKQ